MLLVIDIGNTRIKGAVFEHNTIVEQFSFLADQLEIKLNAIVNKYPNCKDMVIANVGNTKKETIQQMVPTLKSHFITRAWSFPFENKYATPETLGIDRMVLASGAVLSYPNQNRLVIDAGTCITYDFIDSKNNYLGGAISPGIRLRYEALHRQTAKLPLLERKYPEDFVGNSTHESIHVGVIHGVIHEIEGFMSQYQTENANIIIILTGGDADFLAKRLKNTIFANSNFLLESLHRTFQYQINND
ncbi:MAG: type III pantothenate kinase [Flavobacterium sp.]|nr:type III pantothenate kinase [Flavobacterium sp.]